MQWLGRGGTGGGQSGYQAGKHATGRKPPTAGQDLRLRVLKGGELLPQQDLKWRLECSEGVLAYRTGVLGYLSLPAQCARY